jgi:hypothetical protein
MGSKQDIAASLAVPRHLRADCALPTAVLAQTASLDLSTFCRDYVPTLCASDLVIFLAVQEASTHAGPAQLEAGLRALRSARDAGASVRHVLIVAEDALAASAGMAFSASSLIDAVVPLAPLGVIVRLPSLCLRLPPASVDEPPADALAVSRPPPSHLGELAAKLVLNAITTGAHVKRGVIYMNRMVNVGITNQKLFHRAVKIVQVWGRASVFRP